MIAEKAMERIVKQVQAWTGVHGLMYTDGKLNWSHAPVSLLPNPFPRTAFENCQRVQPIINQLMDKISRDKSTVMDRLSATCKADPFTQRLMDIYAKIPEEQVKRGVQFGIFRSDYMLNTGDEAQTSHDGLNFPLQIEINTIAASFACLSHKTGNLHRFLIQRNADNRDFRGMMREAKIDGNLILQGSAEIVKRIPENPSMQTLAASLAYAHGLGEWQAKTNMPTVVLFIVQPGEKNLGDQRALELELWNTHKVRAEFMTLLEVSRNGRLVETGGQKVLFVKPGVGSAETAANNEECVEDEFAVSVVYYRAGYTPDDYPSEAEWSARELMEHSAAIKCPNVGYQLVGTKKIQQVMFEPGFLERYLDETTSAYLRQFFASQFALGSQVTDDGVRAMEEAIADGSRWVLKPQREGGGNNLYGKELSNFLLENRTNPVLNGWVLMQRIFPQNNITYFMKKGEVSVYPSISELGIYGTFVGDGTTVMRNDCAGYLLRTKQAGVDEGGVATGYSVLNSLILY